MALETGTYTNDLVPTNPVPSDGMGGTDDHLRLIKAALKNTFVNFTSAALSSSQAQLDAAVSTVAGNGAPLRFPLGTAALPSVTPVGDPDTGLFQATGFPNNLGIAVGGQLVVAFAPDKSAQFAGVVSATGGLTAAAVVSTGAYSGGTGQLVPIGSSHIWHADTLPAEGGYCWANGGTLSRSLYPVLWALWGTKYGAGDGVTTFNVPNLCELVPIGQRAMGSASSRALVATGVLGTSIVGSPTTTLVTANLPPYTPAGTITNGAITISHNATINAQGNQSGGSTNGVPPTPATITASQAASTFSGSPQGGTSTPLSVVQSSMAVNFIIRIG